MGFFDFEGMSGEIMFDGEDFFEKTIYAMGCKPNKIISKPDENMTIILWDDNTKTIAKAEHGDVYNVEQGIMTCVVKKMFGSYHQYCKFIGEDDEGNNDRLIVQKSKKVEKDVLAEGKDIMDLIMGNKNKSKFEVGDRVLYEDQGTLIGTILEVVGGLEVCIYVVVFDGWDGGHDCHGKCKERNGWYCTENQLIKI
jgi:hypothetical protein